MVQLRPRLHACAQAVCRILSGLGLKAVKTQITGFTNDLGYFHFVL